MKNPPPNEPYYKAKINIYIYKKNVLKFSFSKKPIPIPAEYRPVYKMAQLIFILKISCSGNKASLLKLHLLSWSIKNEKNREELTSLIHNNYNGNLKTWGVDPAVNRALIFCVAEKLCSVEKGKYLLTPKGNDCR